jgi:hypothetical protein
LPIAIDTDVESYIAGRRAALDREIEEVARLADQGKLDGVDLTGGELVISPVKASTPPEAEKLKEAAYAVLNLVGKGIDRRRILALTFTKKAADEMRSRIATPRPDNDYPSGVSVTPHRGEHAARAISWRSRFSEGTAEKIQRAVCVPRVPQRASIIPGAGITLSSVRCWCMRSTNSS